MSLNYSIKKLLNIEEDFFYITDIADVNIKGIKHKIIYATVSKDNNVCPCCSHKLVKICQIIKNQRIR